MQEVFAYSISATELLAFLVTEYDDDAINNFDSIAAKILMGQKHIDAIQLLPDGIICCVYPLKGNEAVIGYNVLADPNRNREAFEASERKELFFAGPLALKQGGVGIVGRQPIYKGDDFWGYSAVIIKLSTLLNAAGIDTLASDGFQFQLSKVNPNTGKEEYFLKQNKDSGDSYSSQVTIPHGEWKLSVTRLENSEAVRETIPIFIFGLLLSFTGAGFIRAMSKAPLSLGQLLGESMKNYKRIFEGTSEGIFRSTMEGKLILANPSFAKIFGYDSPKAIMKAVDNIGQQMYFKSDDREKFLGELLLKGRVSKMEIQSKTKDNKIIWVSVNAHLVYDDKKAIRYIEGTLTDITVRKNDRDKLNEQFEVLMKYAFINSHQVRAHVATLLGLTNLIRDGYISEEERDQVIELINEEATALDKVIRGLSLLINKVEEY